MAWALPCRYHATTNRPILGACNVCLGNMRRSTEDDLASVLVHELLHALVGGWVEGSYQGWGLLFEGGGSALREGALL